MKWYRAPSFLLTCSVAVNCGCPQYADPTVPRPIQRLKEPGGQGDYWLYAPSRYEAHKPTPLVVLCHGTQPWDNPLRQIRDWVKLAEEENFIVAAPTLKGTRGDLPQPAAKQIEFQRDDEKTILAVIRHIRAAKNINSTQVFLTGWSAGCYAVLHTGLAHPELFRGLAVLQGNFHSAYLADVSGRIDPYQPVYVLYGSTDLLTGGQGRECLRWLYDQNAYVIDGKVPGPHRAHPQSAYAFFKRIVRELPLLQLRAFSVDPAAPLTVQFKARASFEPLTYEWSFGDGESSPVARPAHAYAAEGSYTVTLVATTPDERRVTRSVRIDVPQVQLQHRLDE